MSLRIATLIAIICISVNLVFGLILKILSVFSYSRMGWSIYSIVDIITLQVPLIIFFCVLYTKQKK